jgi:hypothetical protein
MADISTSTAWLHVSQTIPFSNPGTLKMEDLAIHNATRKKKSALSVDVQRI